MRVFLFQDRFAGGVKAGTKRQTIRAKARCKPGDELSLRRWTGKPYRSKQEILRAGETCRAVEPVVIPRREDDLSPGDAEAMAHADGFACWADMQAWFLHTHGLPFHGEIVKW